MKVNIPNNFYLGSENLLDFMDGKPCLNLLKRDCKILVQPSVSPLLHGSENLNHYLSSVCGSWLTQNAIKKSENVGHHSIPK